jgi:hypothetical protein
MWLPDVEGLTEPQDGNRLDDLLLTGSQAS